MKRVAFAHIEQVVDFTTREEAEKFEVESRNKGYYIVWGTHEVKMDELYYSVVIRKPYQNYNTGW